MTVLIDSNKLKNMREELLWTQEDLAAVSGLSSRTVQRIEASGRSSKDSLKALAAAYNVNAIDLLRDDSNAQNDKVNRSWVIGPILGVAGGLMGLAVAWRQVLQSIQLDKIEFAAAAPQLLFLTAMTLFTICFPAFMIHRYWNISPENFQGCGFHSPGITKP